jgi:hypothetical protein
MLVPLESKSMFVAGPSRPAAAVEVAAVATALHAIRIGASVIVSPRLVVAVAARSLCAVVTVLVHSILLLGKGRPGVGGCEGAPANGGACASLYGRAPLHGAELVVC